MDKDERIANALLTLKSMEQQDLAGIVEELLTENVGTSFQDMLLQHVEQILAR